MKMILLQFIIYDNSQNPLHITLVYRECETETVPIPGEPCEPDDLDIPHRIIDVSINLQEGCYFGYCGIRIVKDKAGCDELVNLYQKHGWSLYCPSRARHIPLPL